MTYKTMVILASLVVGPFQGLSFAEDGQGQGATKGENKWHCEKTENGKTLDIDAKDKADCKKQGGKWQKGAKHDDHHQ